ncbi:MAG: cytochrome b/b6 domain-containing protein [Bdellovibrionales bacterium]|nr:cytochrome b/b6 domain-containing protein [Bdellovibrionales bacterium]
MKKFKVYDLPTRVFHWLFASLFLGAFFIAKVINDDSPSYSFHMLMGLVLALVVCLRIVWGFIGSRYARFSSFSLKPSALIQYFKQLIRGGTARTFGLNPASSWAAIIMMALALGLATTGYLMTTGNKEIFEDAHELMATTFLIVAITHVAGVILHSIRYKDWIGLSMVSGKKQAVEKQTGIERSHRGVALFYLAIVGAFVFLLGRNYNGNAQTLHLFGNTLQLGESVGQEFGKDSHHKDKNNDDDSDED